MATSETKFHPYISDQLEFGYHLYGYYPFDKTNAYPSKEQLEQLDVEDDPNLLTIILEERVINDLDHRLHGIQL